MGRERPAVAMWPPMWQAGLRWAARGRADLLRADLLRAGPSAGGIPVGGGRHRPWQDRAARAAIFAVFPYPRRLRAMAAPLRVLQRTGLDRVVARSGLPGRVSPVLGAAMNLAPRPSASVPAGRLPERVPARGTRRAVVGMLTGCVQSVFFPEVNIATARVLAAEGCDVVIPRGQACCGALSLHSGRAGEAAGFARHAIETFEQTGVDAIVVNSAGCGSAMKEYADLLADDPAWAARAAALSAKVRDFAEFLAGLFENSGGPVAARHPLPIRAAYHDACHLGHAQQITASPRALLGSIPGLELTEIPDAGMCCGSAGVYNLLQPEAARELGQRKAASVHQTGAPLLISANPGCSLQIASALEARGETIAIAHTAEILDASIRGLPAPGSASPAGIPRLTGTPVRVRRDTPTTGRVSAVCAKKSAHKRRRAAASQVCLASAGGTFQTVGCSAASVAVKPTPISVRPEAASPVIC